jgi:acetyl esterase/lipase
MATLNLRSAIFALIGAFLLVPQIGNAQTARDIPVGPNTVTEDRLPVARRRLRGVSVRMDAVYSTLPGFRPLRLDLYTPGNGSSARPLIIFVHGGGWTIGTKRATANYENWPGVLASFASRGYAVASIEYRLSSEAPYPAAVQDVKAAIRFLKANAARYGVDAARVAIWGGSAGAHLAAMAANTCGDASFVPSDAPNRDVSDCVQAFVGWYGPYDIAEMIKAATAAAASAPRPAGPPTQADVEAAGGFAFFQCTPQGCPPGRLEDASPILRLDPKDPPALLLHGTADRLVPFSQSEAMAARMRALGIPVEMELIDGVGHGWVQPGDLPATQRGSRRAVAATAAYLERILPPGRR